MHPQAQAISTKISYEWKMFLYTYQRMKNEWNSMGEGERNTFLEAFLLHSRVLRDFFIQEPKGDDVSASHLFDDPSAWNRFKSEHCSYLQDNRTRLNKYLTHLTYDRLNEDKHWHTDTIADELIKAWEALYSILSPEQQQWFDNKEAT